MTYLLFFTAASLGAWIISHELSWFKKLTGAAFAITLSLLICKDLLGQFNITYGLFLLTRDLLCLGTVAGIMLLARKNIFLQITIYSLGIYSIFQWQKLPNDYQNYNVSYDDEIIAHVKDRQDPKLLNIINHYNLSLAPFNPEQEDITELEDVYSINIPEKFHHELHRIYEILRDTDAIKWAEYNENTYLIQPEIGKVQPTRRNNYFDDPYASQQWALKALDMESFHREIASKKLKPGQKTRLFILDTGIDTQHEDLIIDSNQNTRRDGRDNKGHGTHCAGIAAAITKNKIGISSFNPGTDWVELHSINVFNDFGLTTQNKVISGIIKAVDNGADVINMSLGARSFQLTEKAYDAAIKYAVDNGVIIVVAAGNSSDDAAKYVPAKLDQVITVTALDDQLNLASFSNHIMNVTYGIAAPGVNIMSTIPGNKYGLKSGTSMASPHVAGLAAVMKALNPSLDHATFHHVLEQTGTFPHDNDRSGKLISPVDAIKFITSEQ